MPSTTDNEFASLLASYGPGLSLQDMRMKQQGGPTTPGKSLTDLEYSYFASNGGSASSSRSDNEGKYWQGNNSLSDDKNNAGSTLTKVRTNLALNPAYENGTFCMYSGSAGTYVPTVETVAPIAGTRSLLLTRAASGLNSTVALILCSVAASAGKIPVTPGTPVTYGLSVKTDVPGATITTRPYWYDSGGSLILGSATVKLTNINANQVYRVVETATPPVDTVTSYYGVTITTSAGNVVGGEKVWADLLTIEYGATDGSYFDGDMFDTFETDYAWTGAANASTSTATSKSVPSGGYTNLCPNPVPASINYWQSNDQSKYAHLYANNEISIDRQATATVDTVLSAYVLGFGPPPYNPALPVGVKYQRSVEVWVDAAAVTAPANSGFNAGTNLPANTWTRIVEQFTGNGVATYVLSLGVNIAGATTGIHAKMRKAQLMENPSGLEQPYFDGSTPDTATMDFEWTGAANSSTSTAKRK